MIHASKESNVIFFSMGSLHSLHSAHSAHSVHTVARVKDRSGRKLIEKLKVDRKLLQDRLSDMSVRNQRGR